MVYDCIILGGGPAGLAAGVYMGRYLRPTLIMDHKKPQTRWHRPIAHNILGFPAGIHRNQLLDWGRVHVQKYESVSTRGATVVAIGQVKLAGGEMGFEVRDDEGGKYVGRGVILAMGVEYTLPEIKDIFSYAGHTIWHCPECDGYKCVGRKIVVIGTDRGSVEMALNATVWTQDVTVLANGRDCALDEECARKLKDAGIAVLQEKIAGIVGEKEEGKIEGFLLEDGTRVAAEGAFANYPCAVEEGLLKQLPLELETGRWVKVDHRMRTNIARCYAAGDIVANAQTQLSVAMGTGATAAIWLHKELLPEGKYLSGREW
ncbi:MAG: NAD(P)/FAD-dependent oxidoreductase [Phycisphaerae bacterium]